MKKFRISEFIKNKELVDYTEYEPLSPMQAIKAHCIECYCWESGNMRKCDTVTCPFNQFLVNDFKSRKLNLSDEQREAMRNRIKNLHKKS